jgi:hypothetical protein
MRAKIALVEVSAGIRAAGSVIFLCAAQADAARNGIFFMGNRRNSRDSANTGR